MICHTKMYGFVLADWRPREGEVLGAGEGSPGLPAAQGWGLEQGPPKPLGSDPWPLQTSLPWRQVELALFPLLLQLEKSGCRSGAPLRPLCRGLSPVLMPPALGRTL